ncbi:prolyl 4-hydroxylase subunit alpha-3 [Lingula anatina]|uniref:procollagen-proline 4-dioxygenase n=1 Tax=Lingula anatina TaxID=7574 RepID=A0A1S3HBJ3_LINAN|nr:prolyl 4-hydroxylase subunit alpha-3 [Lingula anatina]|eukprot:XP_013383378.1 prolyl 4-hydroxylase subunit alpha-3 [Lingula anatina]
MNNSIIIILTAVFSSYHYIARAEVYSSTADVVQLANNEQLLVGLLETYLDNELARIKELQTHLEDIKKLLPENTETSIANYAVNPVGAYSTIKRFAVTWTHFFAQISDLKHANNTALRGLATDIVSLGLSHHIWPQVVDLNGAVAALVRLQKMYQIPVKELADGNIRGMKVSRLGPDDCLRLGRAMLHSDYSSSSAALAIQWMEEAIRMHEQRHSANGEQSLGDRSFQIEEAYSALADAHAQLGNVTAAANFAMKAFVKDPENSSLKEKFLKYEDMSSGSHSQKKISRRNTTDSMYERLCRGDQWKDPKIEARLFCQYKNTLVPIRPVKEEVLYLDPRVSIFYDVITDKEAAILLELAKSKMIRAPLGDVAGEKTSEQRIGKLTWLWDADVNTTVAHLSKRVEEITGLSTVIRDKLADAEAWQIATYGIGGMFEPHHDFYVDEGWLNQLPSHLLNTGRRIATFVFYLTDVQLGGATVFPEINVRVPPVKNAAAFWYNLKRSGDMYHASMHAGCPVLYGQKWIANKWTRERGQIFRRRCGLSPRATDE